MNVEFPKSNRQVDRERTLESRVDALKQKALHEMGADIQGKPRNEGESDREETSEQTLERHWQKAIDIFRDNMKMNDFMFTLGADHPDYGPKDIENKQRANAERVRKATEWMTLQFNEDNSMSDETAAELTKLVVEKFQYDES